MTLLMTRAFFVAWRSLPGDTLVGFSTAGSTLRKLAQREAKSASRIAGDPCVTAPRGCSAARVGHQQRASNVQRALHDLGN